MEIPKLFKKLSGWQRLSYFTIGTYYLVGATSFIFTLIPFLFFITNISPAHMSFADFIIYGSPVAIIAILIYLYVQRWMCHTKTERGLHWRGMILKFACWPVFFLGFILAIVDADIPYIPTAKTAVRGYFTPFARPLVIQAILFILTAFLVLNHRRFFLPEGELVLTAEKTWGMIAFAFIAFIMSVGGIFAALEAQFMKAEDPWDSVDINQIKKPVV